MGKISFSIGTFMITSLIKLSCSIRSTVQFPIQPRSVEVDENVQKFFYNFESCHMKFFLPSKGQLTEENFASANSIINIFNERASFSIDTLDSHNNSQYLPPELSHHSWRRHSACFIQVYQFAGFQDKQMVFKMNQSESSEERPNYFIFLDSNSDNLDLSREIFYSNHLPNTIVNGLTFQINLPGRVQMVCISCPASTSGVGSFSTLTSVEDQNILNNLEELGRLHRKMYSNLHGVFISVNLNNISEEDALICEKFREPPDINPRKFYDNICIHHILAGALNYSFIEESRNTGNKTVFPHGETSSTFYISNRNYEVFHWKRVGRMDWFSYGVVVFHKFLFFVVHLKPAFHARALLQPFDVATWMLILIAAILLFVITLTRASFAKAKFDNDEKLSSGLILVIFSTTLDQPAPNMFTRSGVYGSGAVAKCWLLWFMMLVILGNFYKGEMFSFLTQLIPPYWPGSLKELVESSYTTISFSQGVITSNSSKFSIFKQDYLRRIIELTEESHGGKGSTPGWIKKLQDTHHWYSGGTLQFAYEMAIVSAGHPPDLSVSNDTVPLNHRFAVVDPQRNIDFLTMAFHLFTPNYIMSKPKEVDGYIIVQPWAMSNTYLRPVIQRALAMFYESGMHQKLTHHIDTVKEKLSLLNVGHNLQDHQFPNGENLLRRSNRYYSLALSLSSGGKGNEEEGAMPISLSMLNAVFLFGGVFLATAGLVFVAEILMQKLRKWRNKNTKRVIFERRFLGMAPAPSKILRTHFGLQKFRKAIRQYFSK